MKINIPFALLFIGLSFACVSLPTRPTTSLPTDEVVPVISTSTMPPPVTHTALPTNTTMPTETLQPTIEATGVSFANDVFPILQGWCIKCHGGDRVEEGLNMKTYVGLMSGSDNGIDIIPGNAEKSLLAQLITTQKMPKRGPKLTQSQIKIIIDWINQGALDN